MRGRVISVFYTAWLAVPLAFSLPLDSTHIFSAARRDLLGILGDIDGTYPSTTGLSGAVTSPPAVEVTTTSAVDISASSKASGAINNVPQITSSATTAVKIANPPPLTTQSEIDISSVIYSVPATATPSDSPYTIGDITDASATPPGELTEWKVIGIAVITITFIATAVLAVSFFDSWWGFVRAAVCGKGRKKNELARGLAGETLVPDWEKRSWEFRLANEDGHRYPTLASLESIVKEKELAQELSREEYGSDIKRPDLAYGAI